MLNTLHQDIVSAVEKDAERLKDVLVSLNSRNYNQALRRLAASPHPEDAKFIGIIMKYKVQLKIDINEAAGDLGETALHQAAKRGHKKIYDALVVHGANPSLENRKGKTAKSQLDYFYSYDHMERLLYVVPFEAFKICLTQVQRNGCLNDYFDQMTFIYFALNVLDYPERYQYILTLKPNVNIPIKSLTRNTPLHLVIANEHQDIAIEFIKAARQHGVFIDFNQSEFSGLTILNMAIKFRAKELALYLIKNHKEFNIDLELADQHSMRPIHYAAALGMPEVCIALSDAGADIMALNKQGETAADLTNASKELIIELLESVSIDPNRDENAKFDTIHFRNGELVYALPSLEWVEIPAQKNDRHYQKLVAARLRNPAFKIGRLELTKSEKISLFKPIFDNFTGRSLLDHILIKNLESQHLFEEIFPSVPVFRK